MIGIGGREEFERDRERRCLNMEVGDYSSAPL